jgi:hypothetical protein
VLRRSVETTPLNGVIWASPKIKSIENKTWRYPIEDYEDLVDFSGRIFFDKIREDVGLPAKEPAISLIQGQNA